MIQSMNKELKVDLLDDMIKELDERPEMSCSGDFCGTKHQPTEVCGINF